MADALQEVQIEDENSIKVRSCYICQKDTNEPLVKNPTNHRKVLGFITERAAFGDIVYEKIKEKMKGISIKVLMDQCATFHGSCYRKTVHAGNYKRIKEQYYKLHPRKRPPQPLSRSATAAAAASFSIRCVFCDDRRAKKKNSLKRNCVPHAEVQRLREIVSSELFTKLRLDAVDQNCPLILSCHELCWKKHVTKLIGEVEMKPVRPEDLVEEEFIYYLKEKMVFNTNILLTLLYRTYLSILEKHRVNKSLRDREVMKELIKSKLPHAVIRQGKNGRYELVSLRPPNDKEQVVHRAAGSVVHRRGLSKYVLRPRASLPLGVGSEDVSSSGCGLVNILPDEILLKIFRHLSTEELGYSVLAVCSRWRRLGRDHTLWLHLHFTKDDSQSLRSCIATIRRSPNLQSLDISATNNSNDISDVVRAVAQHCPLLAHFSAPRRPSLTTGVVELLVKKCPQLTYIDLRNFIDSDMEVRPYFLLPLVRLKNLHTLYVGHTRFFPCDLLVREIAAHCKNLQRLDISGYIISDATYRYLLNRLQRHLKAFAFSPSIMNKAFRFIVECDELEELHLKIGNSAFICEQQLYCIRALKNLKSLRLQFSDLCHNNDLSRLFREPTFSNLEKIELSGHNEDVTDDFMNLLGFTMPCLQELTLCSLVSVTDVGLGKLMHRCRDLVKLRLVEMDSLTGACLDKHGKSLPDLHTIEVIKCPRISSFVINQLKLKKCYKKVEILWEPC